MKKMLFFIVCLFFMTCKSQNGDAISFAEVVTTEDSLKSYKTLYANAKIWFTNTFKDPKEVIVLDDFENGILIGRGVMKYKTKILSGSRDRAGWLNFDVKISCKDGRYKYEFTNFIHNSFSSSSGSLGLITNDKELPIFETMSWMERGGEGYRVKVTKEIQDQIIVNTKPLIFSLKTEMNKKISTNEDW